MLIAASSFFLFKNIQGQESTSFPQINLMTYAAQAREGRTRRAVRFSCSNGKARALWCAIPAILRVMFRMCGKV